MDPLWKQNSGMIRLRRRIREMCERLKASYWWEAQSARQEAKAPIDPFTRANQIFERLPKMELRLVKAWSWSFCVPGPSYDVTIHRSDGLKVGSLDLGVSPLRDRIYIPGIDIYTEHRRQGYGTAALWRLARAYDVPITPIHVVYTAQGFWSRAGHLAPLGLTITGELRLGHLDQERKRWRHLPG